MEDFTNQHVKLLNRLDAAVEVGKDQLQQQIATASCSSLPVTYLPFKFENRRLRIDWRLLHGVDITKLVSSNCCGSDRAWQQLAWAVSAYCNMHC